MAFNQNDNNYNQNINNTPMNESDPRNANYQNNYQSPQQQMYPPQYRYSAKIRQCKYCKQPIDIAAKICPHCRKKQSDSLPIIIAGVLLVIFFLPTILLGLGNSSKSNNRSNLKNTSTVSANKYYLTKDHSGNTILVVEYSYYNGEDEPEAFMWNFTDRCYQNGVECSDIVLTVDEIDPGKQRANVQPGYTSTFYVGYVVKKGSEANIVVTRYLNDDEVVIDKRIKID